MPKFQLTSPDGKKYEVTAPEGATEDQAIEYAQKLSSVETERAPQQAQLRDNLSVPFKQIGPAAQTTFAAAMAVAAASDLEQTQTGASLDSFVDEVVAPMGWLTAPVTQIGRAIKKAVTSEEALAAKVEYTRAAQEDLRNAQAQQQAGMPENPSLPLQVATDVVTNVVQNAPGIALSVAAKNPAPALVMGGAMASGGAAQTPLLVDPIDPKFAENTRKMTSLASGLGMTEAAMELTPIGTLIDAYGAGTVKKFLLKYIAQEVGTEVATTAVNDVLTSAIAYPEQSVKDLIYHSTADGKPNLIPDMAYTALVAPISAGVTGMGVKLAQRAVGDEVQEESPTDKAAELVEEMKKAAEVGDTDTLEVLNEEMKDLNGQTINNTSPNQNPSPDFSSTDRLARAEILDPLTDEEVQAAVALSPTMPPPVELQNDGTAAVGVDEVLKGQYTNTPKVVQNAINYNNENDDVPRTDRKILFGPEASVGFKLGEVKTEAGTYTIGKGTEERSVDLLKEEHLAYEAMRQQFMPDATIILSNETLGDRKAIGGMKRLPSGEYLIVPAAARMFSSTDSDMLNAYSFNPSTKAKILYNAPHEFAHALYAQRFYENVTPELGLALQQELDSGQVTEATVAAFPREEQALLREYLDVRASLDKMNAAEFQLKWMSPALAVQRQLIKNVGGYESMPAKSFVRRLVTKNNGSLSRLEKQIERALQNNNITKAQELRKQRDALIEPLVEEYLSFDEYIAEQMSRYAHETGMLKSTGLAGRDFMAGGVSHVETELDLRREEAKKPLMRIMKSLQGMFAALKRGILMSNGQIFRIKAGVAFHDWVDSLAKSAGAPKQITEIVGKAKTEEAKAIAAMDTQEVIEMRRTVTKSALSPREKVRLYKLLRENAPHTAREEMLKMLLSRTKMQLETDEQTGAAFAGLTEADAQNPLIRDAAKREWSAKGFGSKYFQAWFGNPKDAAGQRSAVVSAGGTPLLLSHATQAEFDTFGVGDIGFHFGTPLAAQARMLKVSPTYARDDDAMKKAVKGKLNIVAGMYAEEARGGRQVPQHLKDWQFINAFLNIRNPLTLSEDGATNIWNTPTDMGNKLRDDGVISQVELAQIWAQEQKFIEALQPRILADYGHDLFPQHIPKFLLTPEGRQYRYEMFGFLREMLLGKGYDGIKYENYVEGGTSYVAFNPEQIKTANGTFAKFDRTRDGRLVPSKNFKLQLDVTDESEAVETLSNTAWAIQRYEDMGLAARGLRWMASMQWYVLQLQQLAWIHPEFNFLDMTREAATQYNALKSSLQAKGDAVAQEWKGLGKETDAMLSKVLEKEVAEEAHWTKLEKNAEGKWRHSLTAETVEKLKAVGVNMETPKGTKLVETYLSSKNVLLEQLEATQVVLAKKLARTLEDGAEFEMRLNELRKEFNTLRKLPFLPRGDYGKFGIIISRREGLATVTVHRQMFERKADLIKAREIVDKTLKPGETVREVHELADEHRALLALPTEYVDTAADVLGLSQGQKELLHDLLHPVKTEKAFLPYQRALEKISGGSTDRMRNFANFIWHNSTMIARIEAQPAFAAAHRAAKDLAAEVNATQMDVKARTNLLQDIARAQLFMDRTVGYMLTPPNEWYTARGVVSLVYLMFSLKTALLNLTGITTTWSALTSQHGDVAGNAAFAKAHKQLASLLTTGESGDAVIDAAYEKAGVEGHLLQSYAAHLAGAATAETSRRLANRSRWMNTAIQGKETLAEWGMAPFTAAEQYTRRVTFLAVLNSQKAALEKAGKVVYPETLYEEGVRQMDLLQNSYTLANRPQFMRGGGVGGGFLPLMTIFLSFMVHFTFNATGGYTLGATRRAMVNGQSLPKSVVSNTQRMLILLLLLGGYEALPGAENLLDILDAIMLKLTGKTARQVIREGIQDIPEIPGASWVNDPRWWGKGLGGDVAGFDVSGSLGIGRLVPGTDALASSPQDAKEFLGKTIPSIAGVAGSLGVWATQFSLDAWNGNDLRQNFNTFPGAVGGVASALDWSERGVRGKQGELVYEPSTGEMVGKAFNFSPSGLLEKREVNWAKQQAAMYWTTRRELLQKQYNRARDADDREAVADVEEGIRAFNDEVVDSKMKLLPKNYIKSYRLHLQTQRKLEQGIVPKNVRNLTADVEASFEDSSPVEE